MFKFDSKGNLNGGTRFDLLYTADNISAQPELELISPALLSYIIFTLACQNNTSKSKYKKQKFMRPIRISLI